LKFDTDSKVFFIYRPIPSKLDFLKWLAIFDTTPIGCFFLGGGLLGAFMVAYNIKMLVSGLSISSLRNKQLFKKMDVKSSHFQFVNI
jgi:hypothetical protein